MALHAHDPLSAASFQRRLAAYAIDFVLLALVMQILHWSFRLAIGSPGEYLTTAWRWDAFLFTTVSLPCWFYFALSESSAHQATFGKRAFKVRVVDVYGARISRARALARTIVKMLPWELTHFALCFPVPVFITGDIPSPRLLFAVYGLLALYLASAMLTLRKQSVHDLAAGTYVARA